MESEFPGAATKAMVSNVPSQTAAAIDEKTLAHCRRDWRWRRTNPFPLLLQKFAATSTNSNPHEAITVVLLRWPPKLNNSTVATSHAP